MKRLLHAYRCQEPKKARTGLRRWYAGALGQNWQKQEQILLDALLADCFGYHVLQIGKPGEGELCSASRINHRVVLSEEALALTGAETALYAQPHALPIASATVDVVVLPHVLPFTEQAHELLREVERVLIPDGRVIVLGFNPWSLFGLARLLLGWRSEAPWCGHFYSCWRLRDWLRLLGFDTQSPHYYFYRPPLSRAGILQRLGFMEKWGRQFWPVFGGGYILFAQKRVTTFTPIRPRWQARRLIKIGSVEPTARRDVG